jgi:hypothetical protein
MFAFSFPWIFVAIALVADLAGLYYLWRRRISSGKINYRASTTVQRLHIPLAERRRTERRRTGRAASA